MNYLRIASVIGLVIGVGIIIAGFQLSNHLGQTPNGCVPPSNATCSSTKPSSVVIGWFLLTLGAIVAFVSSAVLAYSLARPLRGRSLDIGGKPTPPKSQGHPYEKADTRQKLAEFRRSERRNRQPAYSVTT